MNENRKRILLMRAHSVRVSPFLLLLLFIPNSCKSPVTSGEDSNQIYEYAHALITYDTTTVYIKKGESIINQYSVPDSYYVADVYYDRITGLISLNKCKDVVRNDADWSWTFELIVWDYIKNKTWVITNGESRNGEGLYVPHMCNYDPEAGTGFMITYGWESTWPIKYDNGKFTWPYNLPGGTIDLRAIIDQDSVIVQLSDEAMDETPFYSYNYSSRNRVELDSQEVIKYGSLMLSQFGKNINYYYLRQNDISIWDSDWNPNGDAVIYHNYSSDNKRTEYYFYSLKYRQKVLIHWSNPIIPIWK